VVWRSVVISQPARLKREHFSLVVEQAQVARVPFEDIAVIVLNNREITLTHPVLSACGEYGISLFATSDTHHPSGVFLPFLSHSRATKWLRLQLDLPKPIAKRTWAAIIKKKIANQSACLRLSNRGEADRLDSYARRVRSGDVGNLEGQAAAYYFTQLFGKHFHRGSRALGKRRAGLRLCGAAWHHRTWAGGARAPSLARARARERAKRIQSCG
jgi:CRISP-associated protein Cas1